MSGRLMCFGKFAVSLYFIHDGGKAAMNQNIQMDFFESQGLKSITFKANPFVYKKVHTNKQSAPRVIT